MLALARASASDGLARSLSAALLVALSQVGCAYLPSTAGSARQQLDFMAQAMAASPAAREAQWQAMRNSNGGTESWELRTALMQSIPDHSGYDPAAARRRLKNFLAHDPSPDLAAVARVRIADLDAVNACHEEVADLRRRVTQVVEIERRQGQERR